VKRFTGHWRKVREVVVKVANIQAVRDLIAEACATSCKNNYYGLQASPSPGSDYTGVDDEPPCHNVIVIDVQKRPYWTSESSVARAEVVLCIFCTCLLNSIYITQSFVIG
jgi:hypothetical protein